MALGNVIGSNIFNITFILGICSMVHPLNSSGITIIDYMVMIAAVIMTIICGIFGKINRFVGALMLFTFIVYTYFLIN